MPHQHGAEPDSEPRLKATTRYGGYSEEFENEIGVDGTAVQPIVSLLWHPSWIPTFVDRVVVEIGDDRVIWERC